MIRHTFVSPGRRRIALVGCAAAKLQRPAPARELYTSQLFRKCASLAAASCDDWWILSAKHGLVHPDTVLEPYDVKLGKNAGPIWTWADRVAEQLREQYPDPAAVQLVAYAGEQYRTALYRLPDYSQHVPMKGLGIGQQLGYLTRELQRFDTPSAAGTSWRRDAGMAGSPA